ncbi:metallophosphoesterase family protein [Amphibacillus sp. Q70]|uniref:metallophosphoesterase family protein n=1 Tax=Amphibacillus sp. Q70 TaxID=3453416 RepID=UPI003F86AA39
MAEKRILAISDIHGCYNELVQLLELCNYQPETDQLILLGDYIDRGPESKQAVEYVIKLVEEGAVALRGNHDQMFLDFLSSDHLKMMKLYLANGGISTLKNYVGLEHFQAGVTEDSLKAAKQLIKKTASEHVAFLTALPYYYETDKHLFIHAGIDPSLTDWRETSPHDMIWIRQQFLYNDHPHDFTVVHGHSPTQYIRGKKDDGVLFGNKKISIDGACAYGGQLNALVILEDSYETVNVKQNN